MGERLTTQDLAESLAEQTGFDKGKAKKFINALTSYISQHLEANNVVKITGLGTFKIIRVNERESVHIQTGERFVIPAHHKLSFVPDKNFKEHVNRPFAFFEPVETENIGEQINNNNDDNVDKNNINNRIENPVVIVDENEISALETEFSGHDELLSEDSPKEETFEGDDDAENDDNDETSNVDDTDEQNVDVEDVTVDDEVQKTETQETPSITVENSENLESEGVENVVLLQDVESTAHQNTDLGEGDETKDPKKEENDTNIASQKEENKTTNVDQKKNKAPLWIWFILVPLLIVLGSGIATYIFLYYNTPNITIAKEDKPTIVAKTEIVTSEHITPFPIGSGSSLVDNDSISALKNDSLSNITNTKAKDDTAKTVKKQDIDWLAPPVQKSEAKQHETKRADKPNKDIERKNATAAKSETTKKTDKGTEKNTQKTLPARVRMTAGSSLTQIAMEHYGDKIFWVYIYEYNKNNISDFNNIPVGTEIRLPAPKLYGIDAKDANSIKKARQKQAVLMKWDNWDDYK